MKKRKNKKYYSKNKLIVILSLLIFFLLISFTVSDTRKLTFIEKTLKDGLLFINKLVTKPFNLMENDTEMEDSIKNKYLVEIDNLKEEIKTLKESLELNTILSDYDVISATTISRNLGYFYDTIILDKGSNDGVKINQAVTTNGGLIGKVIKLTHTTSTVKLLTSMSSNIQVSVQIKVNDKYLYGILTSYDNEENVYTVEGITDTKDIKEGFSVTTTGMGDIFPSGILVGEVTSITKDNFDLEAIIKVKPSINIDKIDYVKILRRKP